MSPSRSNTIWRPSGLTSTFIHVPSEVSNASFCAGPRSAVTSHFLLSVCARGVTSAQTRTTSVATVRFIASTLPSAFVSARRGPTPGSRALGGAASRRSTPSPRAGRRRFPVLDGRVLETPPQIPARDRAVRAPGLADLLDPIGSRFLAQAVQPMDRVDDAKVVDRQDVRPVKAEHEEHLRRPPAESFHLDDGLDDFVVGELVKRVDGQLAGRDFRSEI